MLKNARTYYDDNFMNGDLVLSTLVCVILIFVTLWLLLPFDAFAMWIALNKGGLYTLIATISGTLIGFIITGVSIILALVQSNLMKILEDNQQYKDIYGVYFSTFKWLAFTTAVAIFGILYDGNKFLVFAIFCALMFCSFAAFARLWRCIWVLEGVVNSYLTLLERAKKLRPESPVTTV